MADKIIRLRSGKKHEGKSRAMAEAAMKHRGVTEHKALTDSPQELAPWTDTDLDAMCEISPEDVAATLAERGPKMRNLLEAKQSDEENLN